MNKLRSNTCLAVLRDDKGKLWFAGDRRVAWDMGQMQVCPMPKVMKRDGNLYAGTGALNLVTEIVHHFHVEPLQPKTNPSQYIHDIILPAIIEHLKTQGMVLAGERKLNLPRVDSADEGFDTTILIGVKSRLFSLELTSELIHCDEINVPFAAGCGGSIAWGSLLTTQKLVDGHGTHILQLSTEERLRLALDVAAQVSPGCDNNVDIIHN